ncbi:transporter substrate-binding domain-containing protein [Variovorax sp. PBL-E5]|uniref:transporter substrate-binding domain-containing protein n=1 Tax=Variovorax sp. PBL-E5 TaxID=434014 RepID=UPI0013175CDF|nr:transporter substrate-binding domain-containing protein [Variovorax sp. PBL-E5]VTU45078.1 Bacterial extracellular solute-binding proteins, family 3 [Variovorax sp. PBL-E5]
MSTQDLSSNSSSPTRGLPEVAGRQLAPDGVLRAALNLSNFLLVSGRSEAGEWRGVAPDMARAMASALGVGVEFMACDTPAEVVRAAGSGAWTVAFIGADPARADRIRFAEPYVEIEAGYLVPPGSTLRHADEVDRKPHRIAAFRGSAYALWLASHLQHASLMHGATFDEAFEHFRHGGIDALASLVPKLLSDQQAWPGSRILPGAFMTVQQSVGSDAQHPEGALFVQQFVRDAKATGRVAALIEQHRVAGLKVPPLRAR